MAGSRMIRGQEDRVSALACEIYIGSGVICYRVVESGATIYVLINGGLH